MATLTFRQHLALPPPEPRPPFSGARPRTIAQAPPPTLTLRQVPKLLRTLQAGPGLRTRTRQSRQEATGLPPAPPTRRCHPHRRGRCRYLQLAGKVVEFGVPAAVSGRSSKAAVLPEQGGRGKPARRRKGRVEQGDPLARKQHRTNVCRRPRGGGGEMSPRDERG